MGTIPEPISPGGRPRSESWRPTLLVLSGLAIYLTCAIATLDEPPMGDSVDFLVVADDEAGLEFSPAHRRGVNAEGSWHPRAYVELLVACGRLFGPSIPAKRAAGIPLFLLTVWLTWRIALTVSRERGGGRAGPALAVFLLCTSPFAIKGSVHLDIDNSVLTTSCTALTWALVAGDDRGLGRRTLVAGVVLGAALWTKLTTPWAVLAGAFAYECASRRLRQGLVLLLGVGGIGLALFLISWTAYCEWRGFDWRGPFQYTISAFLQKAGGARAGTGWLSHARVLVRVLLWFSPFLTLLGFAAAALSIRQTLSNLVRSRAGTVSCIALAIFLGYLVVGRVIYGLPKYHVPAVPLFCVISADFVATSLAGRGASFWTGWAAPAVLFLAVAHGAWVGDLLYSTDYGLKEAAARSDAELREATRDAAIRAGSLVAASAVALVVAWAIMRGLRRAIASTALVFAVAGHLAEDALQFRPGYVTTYDYGVVGVDETVAYLRERVPPNGHIIATREILYLSRNRVSPTVLDAFWSSPAQVSERLSDPSTSAFVLSIGGHTRTQRETILQAPSCRVLLDRDYHPRRIGSYLVWTRREPGR